MLFFYHSRYLSFAFFQTLSSLCVPFYLLLLFFTISIPPLSHSPSLLRSVSPPTHNSAFVFTFPAPYLEGSRSSEHPFALYNKHMCVCTAVFRGALAGSSGIMLPKPGFSRKPRRGTWKGLPVCGGGERERELVRGKGGGKTGEREEKDWRRERKRRRGKKESQGSCYHLMGKNASCLSV